MEKIVKRLFIGGTILTALAVCSCTISTYAEDAVTDRPDNGICNDPTYTNTELCKDNNTPYDPDTGTGVFYNKTPMKDPNTTTGTSTFTLTVNEAMALSDVTGFSISGDDVKTDAINKAEITAKVGSNKAYMVSLSSTAPDLTNTEDDNKKIPAVTNVTAGENGWGIKKQGDTVYSDLSSALIYTGSAHTGSGTTTGLDSITFDVGIGISPTLSPGTYKTEVILTLSPDTTVGP